MRKESFQSFFLMFAIATSIGLHMHITVDKYIFFPLFYVRCEADITEFEILNVAHNMHLTVSSWFLIGFVMGGSSPSRCIKILYAPERPEQGD
jgi:hypothetical protein